MEQSTKDKGWWDWLVNREWGRFATIISILIAAGVLFYNGKAFYVHANALETQRQALRVDLYDRLTERIMHRLDNAPNYIIDENLLIDPGGNYRWSKSMVHVLDDFAFYANHNYFESSMTDHLKKPILELYESIDKNNSTLVKEMESQGRCRELMLFIENDKHNTKH